MNQTALNFEAISADLVDNMGSDLTVVNAARVSFSKHKEVFDESDEKLINYLAKHDHWSPFAHPQIQLRYNVPIFVARQEFKHIVGMVRNEMSRRYVDDTPTFYMPEEWRGRPIGAKQGSSDVVIKTVWAEGNEIDIDTYVRRGFSDALYRYGVLLENGVAPEQARIVLPQAMFTSYYVTGSLAAFARFYNLRTDPHAQKEIQDLARLVGPQIEPLYPVSWKVLTNG